MNYECGTQYQAPPSLFQSSNGYLNNNNNNIPSYAYPMQNTTPVQTTTSPVQTTTYSPAQNGLFGPTQSQAPSALPTTSMPFNQQTNNVQNVQNVQFVLCLDQTVFLPDRFELYIDARGIVPPDIKINITRERIEVLADKLLPYDSVNQYTQKRLILSRIYTLPQPVVPELGMCSFRNDCLIVVAPWARQ